MRFLENVRLLYEEMRRAVATTDWIADNWKMRAGSRKDVSPELKDGLSAYAYEQEDAERVMAEHWSLQWGSVRNLAERCLEKNGGLNIRLSEVSTYFSNDEGDDIDVDDPESGRQPEPITIEITVHSEDYEEVE